MDKNFVVTHMDEGKSDRICFVFLMLNWKNLTYMCVINVAGIVSVCVWGGGVANVKDSLLY